jgi:two-component system, NarL family, response regulator LiaR
MDQIRVLIIDEHGAVRRALAARLGSYPEVKVVAAAGCFQEGLERACSIQPDVILLELKGKSGRRPDQVGEMAKALAGKPVGIIVLTSYAIDDERAAALNAGARRYLVKHIDSALLVAEIQGVAEEVAGHKTIEG